MAHDENSKAGNRGQDPVQQPSDWILNTKLNPPIHRSTEEQILLNFNLSQFEATLAMLAGSAELLLFYRSSTDAGLLAQRQSVNGLIGTSVSTETV